MFKIRDFSPLHIWHSLAASKRIKSLGLRSAGQLDHLGNLIVATFFELGATIALGCFRPFNLAKRNVQVAVPDEKTPILLIHGYLGHSSDWLYHRYYLKKSGCGRVFAMNLVKPFQSIEEYALTVKLQHEEIIKTTGRKDLIIIGHSMGGIIAASYATNPSASGSVTDVVTIGSPLQGTKMALLGIGSGCKQMRYQSDFIQKLNEKMAKATQTRFCHIGTPTDLILSPAQSAWPETPGAKKLKVDRLGHASLLFSRRVSEHLKNYILNRSGVAA